MPSLPLSSDSSEPEPSSDSLSDSLKRQAEQGAKVREKREKKLFRQIVLASRMVLTSDRVVEKKRFWRTSLVSSIGKADRDTHQQLLSQPVT